RVIRGYDEEAFKKLAMGTPMVVWNMSDYDEIIQGIDKNRPGDTFLFKSYNNRIIGIVSIGTRTFQKISIIKNIYQKIWVINWK
ncbi:MAG: hypothetical protein DRP84_04625, partial [Spirochaetes bacterium]